MRPARLEWRNWPWATKLALLLAALAIAPLIVVALYNDAATRRELLEAARAQNLQRARGTAQALDTYLRDAMTDLRLVAVAADTVRFVSSPGESGLGDQAELVMRQITGAGGLTSVALTDQSGNVLLSTDEGAVGRSYIAAHAFLRAIAGQSGIDEPRYDPDDGLIYLQVFTPIRLPDGPLLGTAIGRVTMSAIDDLLASDTNFAGAHEFGVLWDAHGIRLSHPTRPHLRFRPFEPLPSPTAGELIVEQRFGPATKTLLGEPRRIDGLLERSRWLLYDPRGDASLRTREQDAGAVHAALVPLSAKRWVYGVFTPEDALLAAQRQQTRRSLLIALLTGVLAVLVAVAVARWATRPLRSIAQAANALAAGDLGRRVRLSRGDEMGQVAAAFDGMADALAAQDAELRAHAGELERGVLERSAALRASEAELRALFAAMSDEIFVLDGRGTFVKVAPTNSEASAVPGAGSLVGKRLADVFPPAQAQELSGYIDRALTARRTVKVEYRSPDPERETWYEASISPLLEDSVVWVARDISPRRRAEEERRELLQREQEARLKAEEANRIKDEFLSTVSHELRTPLNAILGWAWVLSAGRLDAAEARRAVATIERNARAQGQIIDDLLDVSRIITGKLRLKVRPVDLAQVIEAAVDSVRPAADAKRIHLEARLDAKAGQVKADPDRLQQVAWNLLSNAVKFTSEGGRVEIRLERQESQVVIGVTDTGMGIAPEFLGYVFDRFRQADSTTTRAYGGLGLGLAIVRHLVELHGGTVEAASPGPGCGATFTVRLPLWAAEGASREPGARQGRAEGRLPAEPLAALDGLRVLVVDDEADARALLATLLEPHGAKVTAAASSAEALDLLARSPVDALVADIGMPGEDGYSLIRKVRAAAATLPAIALTAYAGDGDRRQALAAGFDRHLPKPIDPAALVTALATLARSDRAPARG